MHILVHILIKKKQFDQNEHRRFFLKDRMYVLERYYSFILITDGQIQNGTILAQKL